MLEKNKIYQGDCMDLIKHLDDKSIDCVITSPPYWQLRDYKWDGQWGLEPTFQLYLENLWSLMDEIWRVLKDDGTAWINLGDTYARGGRNKKASNNQTLRSSHEYEIEPETKPDYEGLNKCLLLIPHRFAIGCMDRNWIIRNDILWAKRNGMPESVTDRFSKKHEYFFFMVKQEKYYFDLDGIRDRNITQENRPHGIVRNRLYDYDSKLNRMNEVTTKIPKEDAELFGSPRAREHRKKHTSPKSNLNNHTSKDVLYDHPLGKNPGSVSDFWDVPTQPSSDEHYAAYNDKLIGKPIVAGCPKDGIILDPFCGTATTGCRALELGRNFIGFEGSAKYVKMANRNLLPYLQQQKLF